MMRTTYAPVAQSTVSHTAEECGPFLRAGIPTRIGGHAECNGATPLNALDNTCIHVGHPALRSAKVVSIEEGDDAFDGTVLSSSIETTKEV